MQPDHIESQTTPSDVYAHNHKTMLSVLRGSDQPGVKRVPGRMLTLSLERVLFDRATNSFVSFDGEAGIEAVLVQLSTLLPSFVRHECEGRLTGLSGTGSTKHDTAVGVSIDLGAGGQVIYTVGPTSSVISALQVFEGLDRRLHTAALNMGCDYVLLGEGYNPIAGSPLDVPLVPRTRWTLLNAHLGQTGRYARDMMRCSCGTIVSLGFTTEPEALTAYRLAVALSPLFAFLTDNVRSFRGAGARRSPRMTRTIVWDEVDEARCGVVPGTFDKGFSLERYLEWIEELQAIMLVDDEGNTSSTGKRTVREVMGDRILSGAEAQGLFGNAFPIVRMGCGVELLLADALRPRMAVAYAALLKGVFGYERSLYTAASLLGPVDARDVEQATHALRMQGWNATIYGIKVAQLVDQLVRLALTSLDDAAEQRILGELTELWDVCMVPRDAFVHQEVKAQRGW